MSIRSAFKSKFKGSFDRDVPVRDLAAQRDFPSSTNGGSSKSESLPDEDLDRLSGDFKECFDEVRKTTLACKMF